MSNGGLVHLDRLHEFECVETALGANRFGRQAELVAKRAGECFVRPIARIERHGQDIGGAGRERFRRFAQAAPAHIAHHRMLGCRAERAREMVARHAADGRDRLERHLARKVAFDKPQRLADRIHASLTIAKPVCPIARRARLIVLARRARIMTGPGISITQPNAVGAGAVFAAQEDRTCSRPSGSSA
jgi:hypothetical protein